jgi:phosphatidylserine decarboxylase
MLRRLVDGLARHDTLNFLVTNRIPRRLASRFMGWFSRVEQPVVVAASIRALAFFAGDLRLDEARSDRFRTLRDCFTRQLRPEARPVDRTPGTLVSPCDGIVVASGAKEDGPHVQAKGRRYSMGELLADPALADRHRGGSFVSLRLTAAMYHRFHAPIDGTIESVRFIPGDSWNVNPATLARVDRVYCRNTRAVIPIRGDDDATRVTLVPVGAVLVSSLHLAFLGGARLTPGLTPCAVRVGRGEELGHFEHGSTIVALAGPGLELDHGVRAGAVMRVGRPLWRAARSTPG